jgi:hypothetical protein
MEAMRLPLRKTLRRVGMGASGAREAREVKSLSSRWRERRVDVNGAGGIAVRAGSWFEPAWRMVNEGNLDAMWQISCHERSVSSSASSVMPSKAPSAEFRASSSRMCWKRFPLAIVLVSE